MENRKKSSVDALLEELMRDLDLVDKFGGQIVPIIDDQDPFQPPNHNGLYYNHGLDLCGDPATEQEILEALEPLGAQPIFIKPADDCDPLTPDQVSETEE